MKLYKTVDAYIASFPKAVRTRLKGLRAAIRKAAPKAAEMISYGMPGYKLNGRPLAYFAGFKDWVSFFPAGPVPSSIPAAKKYRSSKGTMRFPHDGPVPYALVTRIVKWRAKRNIV